MPSLTRVATYRRRVRAPLERVWENVRDWEHLPWLHRSTFRAIELLEQGDWGWRARVALQPADVGRVLEIELRIEADDRYVTRTLSGAGAGTEIRTVVEADASGGAAQDTAIEVAFHLPDVAPEMASVLGQAYLNLYERLWDEDEAMMRRREAQLARRRDRTTPPQPVDLGPVDVLRARLPLVVETAAGPWRVVELDGELLAHTTVCPHWLGPLGEAPLEDGVVTCPWHGWRFDLRAGACVGHRLRLPPAPRVELGADRRARLSWAGTTPPEDTA